MSLFSMIIITLLFLVAPIALVLYLAVFRKEKDEGNT